MTEEFRVLPELRDVLRQAGRVNCFLKDVAALVAAGEPSDSRLMQHLLADVMGDGGQWTAGHERVQEVTALLCPRTCSGDQITPRTPVK